MELDKTHPTTGSPPILPTPIASSMALGTISISTDRSSRLGPSRPWLRVPSGRTPTRSYYDPYKVLLNPGDDLFRGSFFLRGGGADPNRLH